MFCALPWYDLPELRPALQDFWTGWARHAGVSTGPLTHDHELYAPLGRDDLLISQTCGLVAGRPEHHPRILATPVFTSRGCEGPNYRSVLLLRAGSHPGEIAQLRGLRACINDPLSHSGCTALRELVPARSIASARVTGSHEESVRALAEGRADVAAVDCTSWALLLRHRPRLCEGLEERAWSEPAPAPPWLSHPRHHPALRRGLSDWLTDPESRTIRAELMLGGAARLPASAYERLYARGLTSGRAPA